MSEPIYLEKDGVTMVTYAPSFALYMIREGWVRILAPADVDPVQPDPSRPAPVAPADDSVIDDLPSAKPRRSSGRKG